MDKNSITNRFNPDYSSPNLLRRPQALRLRGFTRSRILTVQMSAIPVRSVAKTPYSQGLEPPRDDLVVNNPGLSEPGPGQLSCIGPAGRAWLTG